MAGSGVGGVLGRQLRGVELGVGARQQARSAGAARTGCKGRLQGQAARAGCCKQGGCLAPHRTIAFASHLDTCTSPLQLSPECKDLLNRIFVIDAKKRITIEDIERHPW